MARLYELSADYERLFSEFDRLNDIESELTAQPDGTYTDGSGNIIINPAEYKQDLLTAWFDTLDGIEGEIESKAENIACCIKDLRAESAAIATEKKQLDAREKRAKAKIQSLSAYLLETMQRVNLRKISTPRAALSVSDGRLSVKIPDEAGFIKWAQNSGRDDLLNFKAPEISKTAVRSAIEGGEEIPGASLGKTPSITIK